ncbi:DUF4145 domain-containing protein [Microbacterium sp. PRF11]|uniref:DUF4145 domain-containing protein n=1 Tax=Microbacterium sp. PRF11 TaxID=2962593 RepID=UPI002881EAD2|nr:DUF4145 domain-containing protein [Microbacterium sp. PRF11]MDT0115915.1 DUF4145 domain-containing protein [Microbacterium sp. PRF11]
MAKELSELSDWVTKSEWPKVRCSECVEGALSFERYEVLGDPESVEHERLFKRGEVGWEEESGTFVGSLKCDNHDCGRLVAMAGDWDSVWGTNPDDGNDTLFERFRVRYLNPAPPLLLTPKKTPVEVVTAINTASAVVWISPDSAATQLRLGVEELLTALKVKRTTIKKGKRRRVSAHDRVEILKASRPDVAETLMAVKWIGNSGTHSSGMSIADVAKGAKILEHALRQLYDTSEAALIAEARAINKRRGLLGRS